jgi:hypothetical protein
MSLALAAKHLAARGRGNDSMLVHMSPKEVSALQGVAMAHGGSLSVNPATGLPEASFLESILPTVLGAGLMMIPGVNALGAAALVGGAQYARTGDIGKGLMAGLGAYGGAGIAGGLSSAGAKTAGDAALAQQGSSTIPGIAKPEMLMSPAPIQAAAPTSALPSATPELMSKAAPQTIPGLKEQMLMSPVEPTVGTGFPGMTPKPDFLMSPAVPPVSEAAKMGAGLGQITQSPAALGNFALQNKYPLMASGLSIASKEGAFDAPKPPKEEEYLRPYEYSSGYTGGAGDYPSDYTGERRYFNHTFTPMPIQRLASGGLAGMRLEKGGFVVPADVVSALGNGSSSAGLEILAERLGARPIKGPGDGMSDSIRTSIEGKQKAAIARDEAYVPRENVKQAGGAKRLYDMMDKVRSKAHGKKSQQRKLSSPDKLVP